MRLNLPNYHCTEFELTSDFSISKDKNAAIDAYMDLTLTEDPEADAEGGTRTAYFGARSRNRGITHRVQGRLDKTIGLEELEIGLTILSTLASNQLGPPPREIKSVSFLVESAAELFGPVGVSCRAIFNYNAESGFASAVSLPIPLIVQAEGHSVTHLETMQLSRRENDEIVYKVIVASNDVPRLILHSVDFETTVEWSMKSVRELFAKARTISKQLLVQVGEK